MTRIYIDKTSSLAPHAQIKEQIKIAYTMGLLKEGDILPSIRVLAKELRIGEGVVRRAYNELRALRLLTAEKRKQVSICRQVPNSAEMELLIKEVEGCLSSLLAWVQEKRISSISLARLFQQRARAQENLSPSYAYVDESRQLAERCADIVSETWQIRVTPVSLKEVKGKSPDYIEHFTTILVNSYRQETLLELLGDKKRKVIPVRIRQNERVLRKLRRLPVGSSILLVYYDPDFPRIGESSTKNLADIVRKDLRFKAVPLSEAGDLAAAVQSGEYQLVLASILVWDELPEKVKRLPKVIQSESEPDPDSLEEVRLLAGVLA